MHALPEYHLPAFVILSILIGIVASWAALNLVGRIISTPFQNKFRWLSSGSVVLGAGIWSLHFVAMIGHVLPVSVSYDIFWTALSMLAGIAGAFCGLLIFSISPHHPGFIIGGGISLASGITAMHYIGMAGMVLAAELHYDAFFVFLSILAAAAGSMLALYFWHRSLLRGPGFHVSKLLSVVVMAAGISGLHYIGMAAVTFFPLDNARQPAAAAILETPVLAVGVGINAILILSLLLVETTADRKLSYQSEQFRCLFENHPGMIFEINHHGTIISINEAAQCMSGFSREELLHTTFSAMSPSEQSQEVEAYIQHSLHNHPDTFEMTLHPRSGKPLHLLVTTIPIVLEQQITGTYAMAENITQLKQTQEELQKMAYRDYLTELLNMRGYHEIIKQLLHDPVRSSRVGVLYMDCDGFKKINDELGHESGDAFIKYFGELIQQHAHPEAHLCRIGGDEFAVILPLISGTEDITVYASNILHALTKPWTYNGRTYSVTASIGIARYPEDTLDLQNLLTIADTAMYQAKAAGKNTFVLYNNHELKM